MPHSQHSRPIWLATLVSPWAAPLAFALWYAYGPFSPEGPILHIYWSSFATLLPVALLFVLPASYAATCALGLPWVMWLRRRGMLTWLHVCAGAAVVGIVTAMLYGALASTGVWQPLLALLGLFLGLLCGVSYCFVAGITIRPTGRSPTARAG